MASCYHETNQTAKAVDEMAKALALAPTDASYRRKMASMLGKLERNAEAREQWIEATKYDPSSAISYARLAEVCLKLKLHDEARIAMERAQLLAPQDPGVTTVVELFNSHVPE
jgi:tetratricopeptide (TPR) repeat protein